MKDLIVSTQGGGLRLIIPCQVLIELEKQTGKLTRDIVKFKGGTSGGALLTACVVAGVPAVDILKICTEQGRRVFSPVNSVLRTEHLITTGHQFDNQVLYDIVHTTLGTAAGMKMNDSPISCLITTGNQMGVPWYFTRDEATNAKTTGKATLVDVAVASSCATTYQAPWFIPGFGWHSDGGTVSLADPVYQTLVEALTGHKCYGSIDPANAVVVDLGTGYFVPDKMPDPPNGLLAAVQWVTSSLVGSSKTLALEAAERQWPGLVRVFNPPLWADVDESDVGAIPQLVALGLSLAPKAASDILALL